MPSIILINLLSGLKNAANSKNSFFIIKRNNLCLRSLSILYDLGYIRGFTLLSDNKVLVYLKYLFNNKSVIRDVGLVSRPSKKIYFRYKSLRGSKLNNFLYTNSFIICSTSYGLKTDVECAMLRTGGEPLFFIT